jgi:hypothetical protein
VPGHFTTLWKSWSTSTPSGQLVQEAAEYYYSVRAESVNVSMMCRPRNFILDLFWGFGLLTMIIY